jgi:prophage tail gpP-like protein
MSLYDLQKRVQFEVNWRETEAITAEITVHGWLNDSGTLWKVLDQAYVKSPMLLIDQVLIISAVTFMQDSAQGTRTLLELKDARHIKGGFPAAQAGESAPEG